MEQLLSAANERGRQFSSDICAYNSDLAFTSTGASLNEGLTTYGVYTFRLRGEMYHRIGSLAPLPGKQPRIAQVYIIDTDTELNNRHALMPTVDRDILGSLQQMLHACNPYVCVFQQAGEILRSQSTVDLTMTTKTDVSGRDPRRYNRPTANEVVAVMPRDGSEDVGGRDIVLRSRQGALQRISETASCYDPLHYVLMFPYGSRS